MTSQGRPLPKFGEWDVNNPASADGFTVIFAKARDEKKAKTTTPGADQPHRVQNVPQPVDHHPGDYPARKAGFAVSENSMHFGVAKWETRA